MLIRINKVISSFGKGLTFEDIIKPTSIEKIIIIEICGLTRNISITEKILKNNLFFKSKEAQRKI